MKYGFRSNHFDSDGFPDGGSVIGTGFTISWQRGKLDFGDDNKPCPNGAFIEDVLDSCLDRLRYHQKSQFACLENARAIAHIEVALAILDGRTKRRKDLGVLGTHSPD